MARILPEFDSSLEYQQHAIIGVEKVCSRDEAL